MTLNEVYEAVKDGKRVYWSEPGSRRLTYVTMNGNSLYWQHREAPVWVDSDTVVSDNWHIEQPQYDFATAYQMMKQGKWMSVLGCNIRYRYEYTNETWYSGNEKLGKCISFTTYEIESKWVEVQP